MRQLYVASDLHGNNNLVGIIDGEGKRIFKKKLPNDPLLINDDIRSRDRGDRGQVYFVCIIIIMDTHRGRLRTIWGYILLQSAEF